MIKISRSYFLLFCWSVFAGSVFFSPAPAAAAPWWWVVFSKGDDVSSTTSAVEAWPAWAVDNAAVSDTVYVSSFTYGTGNLDLFNGINGLGTTGVNALAGLKAGANPNIYVFVDNDDSMVGGIQTVSTDADNDTRVEPANSNDAHNKLIVIPGKYVITGSMNFTSGAASAQPNDLLQIRVPAVINRYVSQMEEFRANTWHDNSVSGGSFVFNSANGDTIEVYFSPDDNGNIATGSGPGNGDAGGDVGGDPANGTVEGVVCRVLREASQSCFYMLNIFTSSDEFDSANIEAHLKAFPASGRMVEGAWETLDNSPVNGMRDRLQLNHESRDGNTPFANQFHAKFMVVDQDIVITGSANYTGAAMVFTNGNDENKVVIHDFRLARKYLEYYRRIISTQVPAADGVGANTFETTKPNPATGLAVTPQAASFNLSWTASASGDVTRYFVFIDTAAIDTRAIGDGVDNDVDGLYDEDPRGDADQFPSGTSTADKTASDDDCDGSSDEDPWMWPEIQVKGRASTTATVSSCNVGDALQAGVNYYFAVVAVDTHGNESALDTAGPFMLGSNVIVYNATTLADTTARAGDTRVFVQHVRVVGATPNDTVTRFSVAYSGSLDTGDISRVQLWADDGDSIYDAGDTYVAQLYWNTASGWWDTTTISYAMGVSSAAFLITIDIAGSATVGDTFQSFIPVNGVKTVSRDTGPGGVVVSARDVTITGAYSVVLNEILADPPAGFDVNGDGVAGTNSDEFIEIYNYGGGSVDISGWSLVDGGGTSCTFPAGALLPAGRYAVMFPSDADTAGYLVPALVFAGNNGGFTLGNASDSVTLRDATLALVDQKTWGAEGGSDQSLVRVPETTGAGSWTQHKTADTVDITPYSPGGGTFLAGARVSGIVPSALLSQGDTDQVLLIVRFASSRAGDTLIRFAVQNLGNASDTDLFLVRLVRDNNSDSSYSSLADTVMATLAWSAAAGVWQATGLAVWVPDSAAQYLVVSSIDSSATIGDTLRLRPRPYGTAFAGTDTGPACLSDSNPAVQIIKAPTAMLSATVNTNVYYAAFYGSDTLPLLSFNVTNSKGLADTLTAVTVRTATPYRMDTLSLATLRLWADADTVGELGSGDTFVAALAPAGIGMWSAAVSWPMSASGATLLVTACATASPVMGDSVMLQVPLYGLQSTGADSGPALSAATNSMYQFTSLRSILISEVEGDPAGVDAGAEYVELYNPTGSVVQLNGWHIMYHSSANNPYTNGATATLATFTAVDSIPAKGFFLIGGDTTRINFGVTPNYYNNSIGMNGAALHVTLHNDNNVIIDLVGSGAAAWGEGNTRAAAAANTNEVLERKAADTATGASMAGSDSLAGNAYDSDHNNADWVLRTADPQNAFSETEPRTAAPSTNLAVALLRNVPDSNARQNDTRVLALAISITGSPAGDTLTQFAVRNLGAADSADLPAVRLWRDNNGDSVLDAGDTLVAVLTNSGDTWYAVGIPEADSTVLAGAGSAFLVTLDIAATATINDTFQAQVIAYGSDAAVYDSGPAAAVTNSGRITIVAAVNTNLLIDTRGHVPDTTVARNDTTIVAITLQITGSAAGDTLTQFAVRNLGSATAADLSAVKLWRDNNADSRVNAGDTLVAILTNVGDTWYVVNLPPADSAALGTTGAAFLVTVDIAAGATNGRTFRAQVPAYSGDAAVFDSGPTVAAGNSGAITITVPAGPPTVRISEVLADPPTGDDINGDGTAGASDEFVEIYNYDSAPVDLAGFRLLDFDSPNYAVFTFPVGAVVPAYGRLLAFPTDADTIGYLVFPCPAYAGGSFNLANAGDSLFLVNVAGDTIDSIVYGAEGGNNQSLVLTATGWQQHETADTVDGSSYSPGTGLVAVYGSVITDIPAGFAEKDDTDVVLLAFRLYGNLGGDTLVNFRVANAGTAGGADLKNVRLVRDLDSDAAFDTPVGDSVVATLAWYAADTSWRAYGLSHALADTLNARFLVVADIDTPGATVGRTIQLRFAPWGSITAAAESGPLAPTDSNASALTIKEPSPVIFAAINTNMYYAGLYANDTGIEALHINVTNTWGLVDTITSVTVRTASPYSIDTASIAALKLWQDAGISGQLDAADTFVATLTPALGGSWSAAGLSIPMSIPGATLLFTIDVAATPSLGDSIMLQVPAYGIQSDSADSGPLTAVTNSMFQFVSQHSARISEVEANPAGSDAGAEYIELYNPTASAVPLAAWRLLYVTGGSNPFTATSTVLATFTAGDSVPAYGFYLIGGDTTFTNHGVAANYLNNAIAMNDATGHLALRNDSSVIIDLIGWGTATYGEGDSRAAAASGSSSSVNERKADDTSTAGTMAGSDLLAGNGYDSDHSGFDWLVTVANPQNAFSETEPRPVTTLTVDTARTAPALLAPRGSVNVLVAALRLTSSSGADTLTRFTVHNLGTADGVTDIAAVKLWRDSNSDSQFNAGDLLVAALTNSGDTWYTLNADTALAGGGTYFLITADFAAGAYGGRTFQAQIPAYGCDAAAADSGPPANLTNGETQSITLGVRLAEILADPPTNDDVNGDGVYNASNDEFIELLNDTTGPADLSAARLRQDDGSYIVFPAGTILAAGARLLCFPSDDTDANYPAFPAIAHAGAIGGFTLTNGGDTVMLLTRNGDTVDLFGWGAEGGFDQSLVFTAAGWQQHETADTVDASPYSPGTGLVAVNGMIVTDVPAAFPEKGETDVVMLAFRLYGNLGGDTLVNVSIANAGTAVGADLSNVRLVRDIDSDAAFDTPVGDSVVAMLTWHAADTSWRAYGLNHGLSDTFNARFLVVADIDSAGATAGHTLQLRFAPYGSITAAAESGPYRPTDSNAYTLTIRNPAPNIDAVINRAIYYAGLYALDTGVPLLSVLVSNSWNLPDTLTALAVTSVSPYAIDSRSIAALQVWLDGDSDGALDGSDSYCGTLSETARGQWAGAITVPLPAGRACLLFTADITAAPVLGDSLMLQVPVLGFSAALADTGPLAAAADTMYQYVSEHAALISEFEVDCPGPDNGGEYVEFYNPTSAIVPLNGWKLQYHSSANNPFTNAASSVVATFAAGDSVPAYGFFLVGGDSLPGNFSVMYNYYNNNIALAAAGGHLTLRNDSNVIIDLVGYGTATFGEGDSRADVAGATTAVNERKAFDTSTAASMADADQLQGNSVDNDHSGSDWLITAANPQNAFSDTEPRPRTNLRADTSASIADTTVTRLQTNITALAVLFTGSATGDTLTQITVRNAGSGTATDIAAVRLWQDVNTNNRWDAGDKLAAVLVNSGGDTWSAAAIVAGDSSALGTTGGRFVVTVDIGAGAANGRTFRAELPAYGSDAQVYDSGPRSTLTESGLITILLNINYTVRLSEILADPPASADLNGDGLTTSTDEFIELYNYDSAPVDLGGCRLLNENDTNGTYNAYTFPTGSSIPAYGYVLVFPSDDTTVNYWSLPVTCFAGDISDYFLNNSGDTLLLVSAAGDTLDTHAWGTEGGNNQSLVVNGGIWQQHKTADTVDASAYSPGSPIVVTGAVVFSDMPAGYAEQDDTDVVLLSFRLYGNRDADTLVNLAVTNYGTAIGSDLRNVRLVRDWDSDAAYDTPVGDSIVTTLAWSAADTAWRAAGVNYALSDTLTAIFLVVADIDTPTAVVGRTLKFGIDAYDCDFAGADSGPLHPGDSNAASLLITTPTPGITAALSTPVYYAALYPNDTDVELLALTVGNTWNVADTLTALTVQSAYAIDTASVSALQVWVDAGIIGRRDGSDSYLATLTPSPGGVWNGAVTCTVPAGGVKLLFTAAATATPSLGDSIILQVPAYGIIAAVADSGPLTAVANSMFQYVSRHSLLISELEIAGPIAADSEFIELYNPTGTPVPLNGWKLHYHAAATNPFTATTGVKATFTAADSVPANGFYLLGSATGYMGDTIVSANATFTAGLAGTGGHIVLRNDTGVIIDLVGYGTASYGEGACTLALPPAGTMAVNERKAADTSTAGTMGTTDRLAGNGYDSDSNTFDWVITTANPQNTSSETEPRPLPPAPVLAVLTRGLVPDTTVARNDTQIVALTLLIAGSPAGDTLADFTVRNLGTAGAADLAAVRLWRDTDNDSRVSAGDTLVAVLTNSGDTWYAVNIPVADSSTLAGAGSSFLVTLDIAAAASNGRTFCASIPAYSCQGTTYDSGPALAATNGGTVTVNVPPATYYVRLAEILADPAAFDVNGDGIANNSTDEFIELYNPDTQPADISNWRIRDGSTAAGYTFPAGTIIPAGGYATVFANDADTTGYTVPGLVFAAAAFSLTNGGETVYLINDTGDTRDTHVYGAEGGNNASLVYNPITDTWQVHGSADTTDASAYSPNTGIIAAGWRLSGRVATGFATKGDSNTVLAILRVYGDGGGDTLTAFRIRNLGLADGETDVLNVRLVRDAGTDSLYAAGSDTPVAALLWNTGAATWDTAGIAVWIGDSTAQFLVIGDIDTPDATAGDTIQLQSVAYGCAFAVADAGPANPAVSNSGTLTIANPASSVTAAGNTNLYYAGLYPGDTSIAVLSILVTNSWGLADTLTAITVQTAAPYAIDSNSLAAVKVWLDTDSDGSLDGADSYCATLPVSAPGVWSGVVTVPLAAGSAMLLFTVDVTATPLMGDSLMLQVPANGLVSVNASTGPLTAVTNSMFQYVARHSLLLSEIEADPDGGDAGKEYVEFYNPTSSVVSLNGWKLVYHSSANNPFTNAAASVKAAFAATDSVPAYGFYLIGGDTTTAVYGVTPNYINNNLGIAATGHLVLRNDSNVIIDLVGQNGATYPDGNSAPAAAGADTEVIERKAADTSTAVTMGTTDRLAGNAADNDSNSYDWVLSQGNPQNSFSETEPRSLPAFTPRVACETVSVATASRPPGTLNVFALALTITGDTVAGDTLTAFTLRNLGAVADTGFAAVKLWRDSNGNGIWDAADSLVTALTRAGDTWYATAIAAADTVRLTLSDSRFLVTVNISDSATLGDTFHAQIASNSISAVTATSGPAVTLTTAGRITVAIATSAISGTIPLEGTPQDSGTVVYLYDTMGSLIDSTVIANASGTFVISGVPNGSYYLYYVGPSTLAGRTDGIVLTGTDTNLGTLPELPAGDVILDGLLNILDAAYVRSHMGASDPRADLNRDGIVNDADMAYIRVNFGRMGALSTP